MRVIALVSALCVGLSGIDEPTHPRYPRILLVTAAYCRPCQAIKNCKRDDGKTDLEWLADAGWKIGETNRAHLQIVDIDKNQDLFFQYKVTTIPTLILIGPDGTEVARSTYKGRETFGNLLKKLETDDGQAHSRPNAATD